MLDRLESRLATHVGGSIVLSMELLLMAECPVIKPQEMTLFPLSSKRQVSLLYIIKNHRLSDQIKRATTQIMVPPNLNSDSLVVSNLLSRPIRPLRVKVLKMFVSPN